MSKASMRVRFWGVRGSIPCPGPSTIRYGGNTPCIEVRCGDHVLIFDAGTGLRSLGMELVKDTEFAMSIFSSHIAISTTFPACRSLLRFFAKDYRVRVWAGNLKPSNSIERVMRAYELAVVSRADRYFQGEDRIPAISSPATSSPARRRHVANRSSIIRTEPMVTVSSTAGESSPCSATPKDFPANATGTGRRLLAAPILQSMMQRSRKSEIVSQAGWGHSTWARGVRMADEAGVKHLCLFHHDPSHDDDFMDKLAAEANDVRAGTIVAREGQIIDL